MGGLLKLKSAKEEERGWDVFLREVATKLEERVLGEAGFVRARECSLDVYRGHLFFVRETNRGRDLVDLRHGALGKGGKEEWGFRVYCEITDKGFHEAVTGAPFPLVPELGGCLFREASDARWGASDPERVVAEVEAYVRERVLALFREAGDDRWLLARLEEQDRGGVGLAAQRAWLLHRLGSDAAARELLVEAAYQWETDTRVKCCDRLAAVIDCASADADGLGQRALPRGAKEGKRWR